MKLLRYGECGKELPGLLDKSGRVRSLSGIVADIDPSTLEKLDSLAKLDPETLPLVENPGRIGACVAGVPKFICVGVNYSDHAAESNMAVPTEPILFMKATSAIMGPNDNVIIPRNSVKTDWEVELAVVIGKRALYVSEADALDYVAGYTVCNDISEREFQLERCGQWDKGKGCDSFGPIGPYLVTRDEVADPQNLRLWLTVNGKKYQDGNTKTMIFGVKKLVSYISQFMSLMPGDVISTGTPPGVGLGQKPPTYLKTGDVIELGIDGFGEQRQVCVNAK